MLSMLWYNRSLAYGLPALMQDCGTAVLFSVNRNVYLMLQTLQGLLASRRVAKTRLPAMSDFRLGMHVRIASWYGGTVS